MPHFALEDWVNFAIGRAPSWRAVEMRRHLDEGCERCTEQLGMWEHVASVADRVASYEASEIMTAAVHRQVRVPDPIESVPESTISALLLYDSSREPRPAGMRSSDPLTRQMLYQAGSFIVDINIEVEPDSDNVSVAGQILHHPDPLDGVSTLRVFVVNENNDKVAHTTTNEAGEFELEFKAHRQLRLAVVLNEKRAIVIPSTGLQGPRRPDRKKLTAWSKRAPRSPQ